MLFIYVLIYLFSMYFSLLICFNLNNLQFVWYSYVVVHVFICICTCLAMFFSLHVCLNCRGRVLTKVVRTCDPTPLLYKIWQ